MEPLEQMEPIELQVTTFPYFHPLIVCQTQPMSSLVERIKHTNIVRKMVYAVVGVFSYPGLMFFNKLQISGTEHIQNLPRKNVLFVSNHQTYFADVITFLHIFCAVKWG